MPQASSNYNIFVLNPELVKEWHPTKNAGLKPQDITPGSGRKIWWICNQSHEWEAVVYSRSRGSGCPYCNRSQLDNHNGVTVSNSEFRLEWHPTANAGLSPAYWTTDAPGAVWWLCRAGHKWQATFKARIRGRGCPVCNPQQDKPVKSQSLSETNKGALIERTDSMLEEESLESIFGTDYRKIKRFRTKATVSIQVSSTSDLFYAQLKNFSHEGMCLETSTSLPPGTKVKVNLDQPLSANAPESYDSIIKWCKGLTDEEGSVYNYGLGLKFI